MACRSVAVTRSRPSAARGERGVDRREHSMYSAAGLAAGWTRAGSVPGGLRSGGVSCSGNPLAAGILQLGTEWRDCTPR